MTLYLTSGDKVLLNWRQHGDCFGPTGSKTGTIMVHPTNPDWVIVVSDDTDRDYAFAEIYNRDGTGRWGGDIDVTLIDSVREIWDKLEPYVRDMVSYIARGSKGGMIPPQKIVAIKFLRSATGLGLADAKRAVEDFA